MEAAIEAAAQQSESASPPKRKARRVRSKEALVKFAEKQMIDQGPEILQEFAAQLLSGVKARDKVSMEMVARLFYGDRGPGATSVFNQTVNIKAEQGYKPRGTEAIIRDFEERDRLNRALPEPTPIRTASQIIDAEEV
jgi:hypothetical protein